MCKVEKYINIQTDEELNLDRVNGLKDNAMLKVNPHLWIEWDFEKNNKLGIDIYKATKSMSKNKVWWICKSNNNHRWDALISDRKKGRNCPYCSGQRVDISNSLSTLNPELANEWCKERNKELSPDDVTLCSKKKVWWQCSMHHSHIWMAEINSRNDGKGCPYCSGQKVNHTNSLVTINPELAKEWHPTKNGELNPHNVTVNSGKKVWWQCNNYEDHEWEAKISNRNSLNSGCPYCDKYGNTILKGFNDMWTTNPELAKQLLNPEDGYKYMQMSSEKVEWKCLDCGHIIKDKRISDINTQGLPCIKCTDGFSYPEKIIYNILNELDISFVYEKKFNWAIGKRYDFYIEVNNMKIIIEIHGSQHYVRGFDKCGGRTVEQEQENDTIKEFLAKENGIDEYIIIDARYSEFNYIKERIINSGLLELLGHSSLNWSNVYKNSQKSIVLKTIEIWENGLSIKEISNKLNISISTIIRYLKRGFEIGICNYNKEESFKRGYKNGKYQSKQVVLLGMNNDVKVNYKSISEASKEECLSVGSVNYYCKNQRFKKGYKWMFLSDYENEYGKLT